MKTVNPIHRSRELHRDAGTFYSTVYEDAGRVFSLFDSVSWANQLLLDDALDAAKSFVRTLIPPLHRQKFQPLRVSEKTYRAGQKNLRLYGEANLRYGDDHFYGYPSGNISGGVELPADVIDVELCCDMPVDPDVILLKDEDFFIKGDTMFFTVDLFEILPVREDSNGERFAILYLRGISIDRNYIQDRLGVLLGTHGPSSQEFLQFNNLAMDCVQEGTGYHRLSRLLCKLYDVPCTETPEVVEQVGCNETERWLATDRAVYFAPHSAKFLFKPGETLQAGTILTDAVDAVRGAELPDGIPIVFERRFLGPAFRAGLVFPNEEVPLQIDKEFPYTRFKIIGQDEEVALFWKMFYERSDNRAILSDCVSGGTINPARFIYQQVLYPRAQFYRVHQAKCGRKALPVINTKIFRSLLPPGILFSILLVAPKKNVEIEALNIESRNRRFCHAARPCTGMISLNISNLKVKTC